MDVYQCPCCELRFVSAHELVQHIDSDHPRLSFTSTIFEDALIGSHRRRHGGRHEADPDRNSP